MRNEQVKVLSEDFTTPGENSNKTFGLCFYNFKFLKCEKDFYEYEHLPIQKKWKTEVKS